MSITVALGIVNDPRSTSVFAAKYCEKLVTTGTIASKSNPKTNLSRSLTSIPFTKPVKGPTNDVAVIVPAADIFLLFAFKLPPSTGAVSDATKLVPSI